MFIKMIYQTKAQETKTQKPGFIFAPRVRINFSFCLNYDTSATLSTGSALLSSGLFDCCDGYDLPLKFACFSFGSLGTSNLQLSI